MSNTKNHVYNLMMQAVKENKSLWQIKKYYQDEDGNCDECTALWKKMAEQKEQNVAELERLIAEHLNG